LFDVRLAFACANAKYFIQKLNSWKGANYGEQGTRKRKRQGEEKEEERKAEEVI
jgi:hypothetical protein